MSALPTAASVLQVDHHAPEAFVVRCRSCGVIAITSDRPTAHERADAHALSCGATGVTPVSPEPDAPLPDPGTVATVTYHSRYSDTEQTVTGPVETAMVIARDQTALIEVTIEDPDHDRYLSLEQSSDDDQLTVASHTDHRRQRLGPVTDVSFTPVAADGGIDTLDRVRCDRCGAVSPAGQPASTGACPAAPTGGGHCWTTTSPAPGTPMTDGGNVPTIPDRPRFSTLTGFQRDLLVAIRGFEVHYVDLPNGVTLHEHLSEQYASSVPQSRVYTNLSALIDATLVAREPVNDRTNGYRTTDYGAALLASYLDQLERQLAGPGGDRP